jgi:hypothetical protein
VGLLGELALQVRRGRWNREATSSEVDAELAEVAAAPGGRSWCPGPRGHGCERARIKVGLAGCVLAASLLAGCTSARSSLGTTDASCYQSLPTATNAGQSHGRLIGLHLYTLKDLKTKAPHLYKYVVANAPQHLCEVGLTGKSTKGKVSKALGKSSGELAVVVATSPGNKLLATLIFSHAPLKFGHSHPGVRGGRASAPERFSLLGK